jgi:hypothetical protein
LWRPLAQTHHQVGSCGHQGNHLFHPYCAVLPGYQKMMALDSDISKFNAYEQEQILALTAQVHQLRIAKVAPKKEKRAPKDSSKGKQDREKVLP